LVFDVRKPGEYASEHIENVSSTPLDFLNDHISEFPTNKDFYVHCAGGYRSVITASILKARGFNKVIDVAGGYSAIRETGIKRTDVTSCSSSK
jgi:rhodanese-related sulfurtransferase